MSSKLNQGFFLRDVLDVAPELLGKTLVRKSPDGSQNRYVVTETEAYRGAEDRACHASKGRTSRTEVMFHAGGVVYVYLIYGMYWMLNIVTSAEDDPQAVLIRGMDGIHGPGKVGRTLMLDRTFYGENLAMSDRLWFEESSPVGSVLTCPRVGIKYAGDPWVSVPWRFYLQS